MLNEGAKALLSQELPKEEVVDHVYLAALSRQPNASERAIALELISQGNPQEGMADFLWTIFVQPEFFYIR
jgi:hypothetical protein